MIDTKNIIKKMINNIFAMPAAVPAMPPNPNTAAIKATIKNKIVQLNIKVPFELVLTLSGTEPGS